MKGTELFISLLFLTYVSSAQNVTMAKAFFKKAQKEFEAKNYKEALNLIEKTKENLNGETNPDILYLEAMVHYNNDFYMTEAKNLINQFIALADEDDNRINELTNILVDFETSPEKYADFEETIEYWPNGNKKEQIIKRKNGVKEEIKFYNNGNYKQIKVYYLEVITNNNNIVISRKHIPNKKFYYDEEQNIIFKLIFNTSGMVEELHFFSDNYLFIKLEIVEYKRYYYGNKKNYYRYNFFVFNKKGQYVQQYGHNPNKLNNYELKSGNRIEINQLRDFYSRYYKSSDPDDYIEPISELGKYYYESDIGRGYYPTIIEIYPNQLFSHLIDYKLINEYTELADLNDFKEVGVGLIKQLEVGSTYYHFNNTGVPTIKKKESRRKRFRGTFLFDNNSGTWVKQ